MNLESSDHKVSKINVSCELNGKAVSLSIYPMARLLDVLREEGKLTGTKEGCGEGECGACSVLIDGTLVNSCMVPAIQAEGTKITTIEGVASPDELTDVQDSFLKNGGAQCGICTPGMVLASLELLKKHPQPTEGQIREGLAGNLCRCTGYMRIFDSVMKSCGQKGFNEDGLCEGSGK